MPSEHYSNSGHIHFGEVQAATTNHFMRNHNLYYNHTLSHEETSSKVFHTDFLSPPLSTANSAPTPQAELTSLCESTPSRLPFNANLILNFPSPTKETSFYPNVNTCSTGPIKSSVSKKDILPGCEPTLPYPKRRIINLERSLKSNSTGMFSCRQCQQKFPQRQALYKHQWIHSRHWPLVNHIDLNSPDQLAILQAAHVLLEISDSKSLEE